MTAVKALIAMSGGVDSSVAAKLMTDAGYECVGCTMKLHNNREIFRNSDAEQSCCTADDIADARSVAERLNMPYYLYSFEGEFREKVIDKFINSYLCGMTPNPCVDCNRHMKFTALYEKARELGCEVVATGHYARVEKTEKGYVLKKALDPSKDQSYVLYNLTQAQLAHTVFPLGGMSKTEARAIAESCGFINADKPDSQDICFVPDGDYASVIEYYTGRTSLPGDFTDTSGKVLGRHNGIIHYTIGQHRGLGLGYHEKLYVCGIDAEANTVILGHEEDLFTSTVYVRDFNWIAGDMPDEPVRCLATVRYRRREQPAVLYPLGGGMARLEFEIPQRAAAPGQSAVLYDGDLVLGGGTICRKP